MKNVKKLTEKIKKENQILKAKIESKPDNYKFKLNDPNRLNFLWYAGWGG
jgi:hypothetical protein